MSSLTQIGPSHVSLHERRLFEKKESNRCGIAVGVLIIISGIFLALAAHQILPSGVNAISATGWKGVALYTSLILTGAVIITPFALRQCKETIRAQWQPTDFIREAEASQDIPSDSIDLYYQAAVTAYQKGGSLSELEESLTRYFSSLSCPSDESKTKTAQTYILIAERAYKEGNYQLSAKCFAASQAIFPIEITHVFFWFAALVNSGDEVGAKKVFQQHIPEDLQETQFPLEVFDDRLKHFIFSFSAERCFAHGDHSRAILWFDKADKSNQVSDDQFVLWFISLLHTEQHGVLIQRLKERRSLFPFLVEQAESNSEFGKLKNRVYVFLGQVEFDKKNEEAAVSYFQKVDWTEKNSLFHPYFVSYLRLLVNKKKYLEVKELIKNSPFDTPDKLVDFIEASRINFSVMQNICLLLGRIAFGENNQELALRCFELAEENMETEEKILYASSLLAQKGFDFERLDNLCSGMDCASLPAQYAPLLAKILLRFGNYHLEQYNEHYWSNIITSVFNLSMDFDGNLVKAVAYYLNSIPFLDVAEVESHLQNFISAMEAPCRFREHLIGKAKDEERKQCWQKSALMYWIAMQPEKDDKHVNAEIINTAGSLVECVRQGVHKGGDAKFWIAMINKALATKDALGRIIGLEDPHSYDKNNPQEQTVLIVESQSIFLYRFSMALHYYKGCLLEASNAAVEEVLAEYKKAYDFEFALILPDRDCRKIHLEERLDQDKVTDTAARCKLYKSRLGENLKK